MPDYSINILWEPVEIPGVQIPCCRVRGWECFYAIGCDGRLFGNRGQWRELNPATERGGHRRFHFRQKPRMQSEFIHSLVLEAFRQEWPGEPQECRHLDGDPGNNWWWNLQWGTRQENVDDKEDHGNLLTCDTHPFSILTSEQVIEARIRYARGESSDTMAREWNVHRSTLNSAITGKSWFNIVDPAPVRARRQTLDDETLERMSDMIRSGASVQEIVRQCNGVKASHVYQRRYQLSGRRRELGNSR